MEKLMAWAAADPEKEQDPLSDADLAAVGIKAFTRIAKAWKLSADDASRLADVAPRTWQRMASGEWTGQLTQDQLLRLSALVGVYKGLHLYFNDDLADRWPTRPNTGPLFQGQKPVTVMQGGGLPAIIDVRGYIDAIRGGM